MIAAGFREVREIPIGEKKGFKTILAFERAKMEVSPIRKMTTINAELAGHTYPHTDVPYKKHVFHLGEERVEGVFPKFESKFDVILPREIRKSSDMSQFSHCTAKLRQALERNPALTERFTPRQLEQVQQGAPRISGLTWHHNEVSGKMQLVDGYEHAVCRHTGGRSLWGGGMEAR